VGKEVVSVLSDHEDAKSRRSQSFRRIFSKALDLDVIARRVLGRHWRQATEVQRRDYTRLFRGYIVRTYAVQLGGFKGEKFAVLRQQPSGDTESVVTARITRDYGAPLDLRFRVRRGENGFRIVDVTIAGVSLIVAKRSEFDAIIRREGLPGLLRRLDEKSTARAAYREFLADLVSKSLGGTAMTLIGSAEGGATFIAQ